MSLKVGLLALIEARPGKEEEVARFLADAVALATEEPRTLVWYAVRLGSRSFAIFDAFADEAGRTAHLEGRIAAALMGRAAELLASPPDIRKHDVLAAK